mmetsp:Transcript_17174/g.32515  ORF Transcript_17174/g.32515 Transcript_17174/m.32515 type:complete len:155 (-) Transcript_17174:182-646(-)|eukprot:CAMPEP_0176502414 /NCGR_PEP_ID=MMETSP0200_2-20121128/14738_1 /TAXON_ID=947934 /ORGANISM="Chaetoceros sp., Strain GSL56" /LENGTH=154 /DNA_ID=CAMNT_0017901479 /DNA_START=37 /DNA_END=501 /DNA_ORIENTATION=-
MRQFPLFHTFCLILITFSYFSDEIYSFAPTTILSSTAVQQNRSRILYATGSSENPEEVIGKTIIVKGDVNGGYVRTCIKNEASNFRRLIGTMSPPGDDNTATIYVEGKRKMVEGFVRWCSKGTAKVGLSQKLELVEANDEVPTGLYDGFYVKLD